MAILDLHDALAPVVESLGFVRLNKRFVRMSGELPLTVWFNPENRLKRIRTISVDCGPVDAPIYVFDQSYAASRNARVFYSPETPHWPQVLVDDFNKHTVPFIKKAEDVNALLQMLINGEAPPHRPGVFPSESLIQAYVIAKSSGRDATAEAILEKMSSVDLDWRNFDRLRTWSEGQGIALKIDRPLLNLRWGLDRNLPRRLRGSSRPRP